MFTIRNIMPRQPSLVPRIARRRAVAIRQIRQAGGPVQRAGGVLVLVGAVGVGYGTVRYRRAAEAIRRGDVAAVSASTGPTVAAGVLLLAVLISAVVLLTAA